MEPIPKHKTSLDAGFSFLELIIVLAVVGILTSFAYPHIKDSLCRIRRSDGQTALLALASRMEAYYATHATYKTATLGQNTSTDVQSSSQSLNKWYHLRIALATKETYTLQAIPQKSQATNDILCPSLTLSHLGEKGVGLGPLGTPSNNETFCW